MRKSIAIPEQAPHEYELEYKEISLFQGGKNITSQFKEQFESRMGVYNEEKDSWIFPSPLDAIETFGTLGKEKAKCCAN